MKDPLVWLAFSSILVQGIFAVALVYAGTEARRERLAAGRKARATNNLVAFIARHSNIPPDVLAREFDDSDRDIA